MHHVAITVPDLAPAVALLVLLGLTEVQRAKVPGGRTLVLLTGQAGTVELIYSDNVVLGDVSGILDADLDRAGAQHPAFVCDDLDAVRRRLADHGHPSSEPSLSPYGLRFSFLRMPGGCWIELLGP